MLFSRRRCTPSALLRTVGCHSSSERTDLRHALEQLEQRVLLSADFPGASNEFRFDNVLAVTYADFDGDSILDAAVSLDTQGSTTERVRVLKGRGDSSFGAVLSDLATPAPALEIISADFNGDGSPDLVAVTESFFAVALNNGSGSLGAWDVFNFATGYDADSNDPEDGVVGPGRSIAVGDVSGDGIADLAVGDAEGNITVFFGRGDGRFDLDANYDLNSSRNNDIAEIRDVELADFDGDGDLDIVAVTGREYATGSSQRSKISTWTNTGAGSFVFHCDFRTPDRPIDVEVADIDGNGDVDLIVLNDPDPTKREQRLTVVLGTGGGAFVEQGSIARGIVPRGASLEAGNLDGSPAAELIVGNGYGQIVALAQYNASDNTFGFVGHYRAGDRAVDVKLADLDGDGALDALIADFRGDLIALRGVPGSPAFIDRGEYPGTDVPEPHVDAFAIAHGDFDGDGDQDIFVSGNLSMKAYVLLNNGDGSFAGTPNFTIGKGVEQVVSGDLNGDGLDDIVVQGELTLHDGVEGAIEILISNGDGTFSRTLISRERVDSVALGDLDGDGDLDLIAARDGVSVIWIYANDGAGNFAEAIAVDIGNGFHGYLAVGDLNGDGRDDIVAPGDNSDLRVLYGAVTGFVTNLTAVSGLGDDAEDVAIADFNNDGALDVVVSAERSRRVEVLLNDGAGGLNAPIAGATLDRVIRAVDTGDFNRDGNLDVALSGSGYGDLIVLYGLGDGSFGDEQRFIVTDLGDTYGDLAVADYNNDGADDVAGSIYLTPRWEVERLRDINVLLNQAAEAPPQIDAGSDDRLDYTEDDGDRQLLPTVTVSGDNLLSAEVRITSNYAMGEDTLVFAGLGTIIGSFNAAQGVLTLSGPASAASYQAALRSVIYRNDSQDPSDALRTLTLRVTSSSQSASANAEIVVTPVDDAPVLAPENAGAGVYIENDPPTPLIPTLVITDVDSTTLQSARITIDGFVPGQDFLRFGSSPGLSVNFNPGTGVLNVTGVASLAAYQAFLRSVAYENTSENPAETTRGFLFRVTDDTGVNSNIAATTLDVVAVNDPPTVDPDGPGGPGDPNPPGNPGDPVFFEPLVYVENDPATLVLPDVLVGDLDGDDIVSAVVGITAGFNDMQDVLSWDTTLANSLGINAAVTDNGATVSFSGVASVVDYSALLASIRYENLSENPGAATREFTFLVSDGQADSRLLVRPIDIVPENDGPGVDPLGRGEFGVFPTSANDRVYTENDPALILAPNLIIRDVDNENLAFATVTIVEGFTAPEDQLLWDEALASSLNMTVTLQGVNGGTDLQLRFEGDNTIAEYESVLRSVAYFNASEDPSDVSRLIEFIVNDGIDSSPPGFLSLGVVPVNDPAVIDPDGPTEGGPGDPADADPADDTLDPVTYTEDGPAVDLFPAISISDVDDTTLASATLTIGGWLPGEDRFVFDNLLATALGLIVTQQNTAQGFTVTVTGEMGPAPIAAFQSLLRSFDYRNDSQNPSDAPRNISLVVNDGADDSAAVTRIVNVQPVNDAPVIMTDATLTFPEDSDPRVISPTLTLSDVDDTALESARVRIASGFVASEDVLGWDADLASMFGVTVSITDAGAGLLFQGAASLDDYRALLRSVTYLNTSDNPAITPRRVDFIVNDGDADSLAGDVEIGIVPANDAPVIDPDGPTEGGPGDPNDSDPSDDVLDPLVYIENDTALPLFPALTISDPDDFTLVSATVTASNWNGDEDIFAFDAGLANTLGLVVQQSISGGVLTVSVAPAVGDDASIGAFQQLIRTFSYANGSDNPSIENDRLFTIVVNDGVDSSAPAERLLSVQPIDDAPRVNVSGSLEYTENDAPTPIAPALTISDPDSTLAASATVRIASGYVEGEDILDLASNDRISASFDASAGLLTLTALAPDVTIAEVQAALAAVTYENLSDDPSDATRVVEFSVETRDRYEPTSTLTSLARSVEINVTPVNDPPVIDLFGTGRGDNPALDYFENDGPVVIASSITITDPDDDTLSNAAVLFLSGYVNGEDILSVSLSQDRINELGFTRVEWLPSGAILVIEGVATLAAYEEILESVTYTNNSEDPRAGARVVQYFISDGNDGEGTASKSINVFPVNDAPVIDVDGVTPYTENAPAVPVAPNLSLSDVDNLELASATVRILDFQPGLEALTFTPPMGLSASFDADTGVLTITGLGLIEDYRALLAGVGYVYTGDNPPTERSIEFVVSDGEADSEPSVRLIDLTPVNDPPTGNPDEGALVFTEDDPATPLAPTFEINDPDSDTLVAAEIRFASGYVEGEDILAFAAMGAITGVFDAASGVLTLSGTGSLAEYEAAIRSVTYLNTSQDPSDADRLVEFRLDDGEGLGEASMRTIEVIPVNDAPDIDLLIQRFDYNNPGVEVTIDENLNLSDVDDDQLAGATVAIDPADFREGDRLTFSAVPGITGSFNAATGVLTFAGLAGLDAYRTLLRSVAFVTDVQEDVPTERAITFRVTDPASAFASSALTADIAPRAIVENAPVFTTVTPFEGRSGAAISITYAELLAASDATDPDGDTIRFRLTAITQGALLANGIELRVGDLIGPGDVFTYASPQLLGLIEGFRLVAFDGELSSSPAVPVQFNLTEGDSEEVQPLTPGSSVGRDGTENVAVANVFGEVLLFQDRDKQDQWTVVNLTTSRNFPRVIGNVVTFVDSKDEATYAIGVALEGENALLLFRQQEDGSWTIRNLSEELGVDTIRGGTLAAVEGPDGLVRISGLSDVDNALVLFTQTGEQDTDGNFLYSFLNLFDDELVPAGETVPEFQGQMISWVATWGSIHIAGVDINGSVWGVWTAPRFEGRWQSDNLSLLANTPAIEGAVTVLITPWQTFHITGADADGNVVATWWAPSFGGNWRLDNLTDAFGGPAVKGDSLQAYVTDWGGLNYAAVSRDNEAVVYWWSAGAGTWTPTFVRTLAPEAADIALDSITGISGPFTTISLFGVGQSQSSQDGRKLYAYFWDGPTDTWTVQNLSETAASLDGASGPLDEFADEEAAG